MQSLETILAQTAALKVPEWPSYGNFRKVTQNPHFLQKCKGGTKGNFTNIALETGEDLGANSGSKSARMAKLWQFSKGLPKPAFSEKVQMRDQEKFFKNRPKRCPRWKGPKSLWRKCHYPLISMHLKCKAWKRSKRRQRLKKCPNGKVMAIFARSPKTRIFRKSTKVRPREVFQKLPRK